MTIDLTFQIIQSYDGGDYVLNAAVWMSFDSSTVYEIGIKRKDDGAFWRCQSSKFNHQTVQEVANAMAILLRDKTENYDPEWCKEFMCP